MKVTKVLLPSLILASTVFSGCQSVSASQPSESQSKPMVVTTRSIQMDNETMTIDLQPGWWVESNDQILTLMNTQEKGSALLMMPHRDGLDTVNQRNESSLDFLKSALEEKLKTDDINTLERNIQIKPLINQRQIGYYYVVTDKDVVTGKATGPEEYRYMLSGNRLISGGYLDFILLSNDIDKNKDDGLAMINSISFN